jgi:hypothetical protein
MRWFIEVSRIGDDTPIEKYTLEAKQWQAALQEARKLRGDVGPLSKFSIELLEHGYRAVDPTQQVRYVVNKAPGDAMLSERPPPGGMPVGSFPKIPSTAPAPVITTSSSPGVSTDPMASDPLKTDPVASGPRTDPMAALPPESAPPNTAPVVRAAVAPPAKSNESKPARPLLTVPEDTVPRAKANAAPSAAPKSGLDAALSSTQPLAPPPDAKKESRGPTIPQLTQRSIEATREPDFQLIRKREESPTEKVPIHYREYAYAVRPGTDKKAAEVLLWMRFREVVGTLKDTTGGKFIQLAVFDHVFEKKPARPPIATLAWKDWRGEPVLHFQEARSQSKPPPSATRPASAPPPAPQVQVAPAVVEAPPRPHPSTPPAAPRPAPVAPSAAESVRSAVPPTTPSAAPSAPAQSAPITSAHIVPAPSAPSAPAPSAPVVVPVAPVVVPSQPAAWPSQPVSAPEASAPSITISSAPASSPEPAIKPPTPSAGPTVPIRRRAGEDLIGELFETMHDLHFMPDVMSGVDFVLGILNRTLPSEAALVHVFDINTRQFIVVRAFGPSPNAVILHRTPDKETLFRRAMRSTRATRNAQPENEESYRDGRWALLGVTVNTAILGPVQLAGRFLGAIELVNPLGGEPYSEHESHALDYICEQFAEFLAARPIVVDADVVLGSKH